MAAKKKPGVVYRPGTRVVVYDGKPGIVTSVYMDAGGTRYEVTLDAATSGCTSGGEPIPVIVGAIDDDLKIRPVPTKRRKGGAK